MAHSRKDEARALDADEREFVERSHHPNLGKLPDAELSELLKLLRERRDRAQAMSRRQRREMRGKSEARGARPAKGNVGTARKTEVLAMAVRRVNGERTRRTHTGDKT